MAKQAKATAEAKDSNILKTLNEKYGKGSVILGSDTQEDLEVVDTGSITLNKALDCGGAPIGKLIEMYGPESSGKSTIGLHILANFQKLGRKVALIDAEHSFDRKYAKNLGVDINTLYISQPDSGEQAYQMAIDMAKSGEFALIVLDSHTAMIPQKLIDNEMGEATMAVQARMNSLALSKLKPLLRPNNCSVLAISQLRTNIGGYGDPNIPTGGNGYKFYSDIRLKVSKLLEKDDATNRTTVEVVKNKCGVPYGKASFGIVWGKGIDRIGELIDIAVEAELIKKGGAWYEVPSYVVVAGESGDIYESNGHVKLQGESKVKQYLSENPYVLAMLEDLV
jgi:recombination protein RecA